MKDKAVFNQHRILRTITLVVASLAIGEYTGAAEKDDRPNVLFIAIDDMNDWAGCLRGHPQVKTPHIDALARRGVLFTNAHCAAPLCNPSRAAVFTGRQPFNTGIYSNGHSLKRAGVNATMMPQAFKAAGYRTYGTGKLLHSSSRGLWDEEFFPKQRWSPFVKDQVLYTEKELPTKGTSNPRHVIKSGPNGREYVLPLNRMPSDRRPNLIDGESFDWGAFDIEDGQMGDGQITDWVCDRLSQYRKSNASNPFFLAVGYYRPHIPLYAPSRYFKNYPEEETVLPPILKNDRADLPETAKLWVEEAGTAGKHATVLKYEQHKAAVAAYLACITFIDTQVGRLIEALNDTGQADNTIVVLWSDHGWHLGEKQHWGKWTGWERSTRVPLIFAAGRATTAKQVVPNRQCSAPVSLIDMYPTLVEMCNLPKVAGLDGQSLVGLLNDPSQSTGRVVVTTFGEGNYSLRNTRYRYIRYADGSEELYDHKNDPNEWKNRAEDPQLAHVKNAMKQELPSN